jgi:hypothetical protein
MFPRNFGWHPTNYMALYPRIYYCKPRNSLLMKIGSPVNFSTLTRWPPARFAPFSSACDSSCYAGRNTREYRALRRPVSPGGEKQTLHCCAVAYSKHVTIIIIITLLLGVGIAQSVYGLEGPGSIPGTKNYFSIPQRPDRLWGPPGFLSDGYRGLFPRARMLNSPPSSAEVNNGGAIPPLPHMP